MSQVVQQEALTRVLIESGMFTKEEFLNTVRVVDKPCCCIKFGAWIHPVRNYSPAIAGLEFLTG